MSNHFNETALAELIVRGMDVTYASANIKMVDECRWDSPYSELTIKFALFKMFGVGDMCYLQLRSTCESRGYPVSHVIGMLTSVENGLNSLMKMGT